MALTIGEAQAVNVLIDLLLAPDKATTERWLGAANLLAQKAHKALGAGWSGNGDVERALYEPERPSRHLRALNDR